MTNEEAKDFLAVESCKRCRDYRNGGCYGLTACFMSKQRSVLALENQIEAEKKPKRRIDTMTEYELSDLLYRYIEAKSRSCRECPVHGYCYVHPPVGCTRTVVRYLLSPAEEKKK